jgi:hypothetical protein
METARSSETSVYNKPTWRHVTQDGIRRVPYWSILKALVRYLSTTPSLVMFLNSLLAIRITLDCIS